MQISKIRKTLTLTRLETPNTFRNVFSYQKKKKKKQISAVLNFYSCSFYNKLFRKFLAY